MSRTELHPPGEDGKEQDKRTGVVKKIIRLFNDNRITPDEAREVVHRIGEIIRVSETE